ncbi:MAG: hypothetical protein OIF48_17770 [Silicimonas sp.]|nr:hypothetical protein [Silicimonas sp.]
MRDTSSQAFAASHLTRVLILSYFVALALGLIKGADLSFLLSPLLSQPDATILTSGLVVALSALVLFGVWRRPAALILALTLFWASYLTMFSSGDLAGFWRDLALIGGLLMTAGVGQSRQRAPQDGAAAEPIPHSHVQKIVSTPQMLPEPPKHRVISRFREDFDIAREA